MPGVFGTDASRRTALILWLGGVLGGAAVLPYAFALQAVQIQQIMQRTGVGTGRLVLVGLGQTAFLMTLAVLLGMRAAARVGLETPVLEALVSGRPAGPALRRGAPVAVALGLGSGGLVVALDLWGFVPRLPSLGALNQQMGQVPVWKGALASIYGGISEEILLRLLVMSALAMLIRGVRGVVASKPPAPGAPLDAAEAWPAILGAAVLFGAGHLPAAAGLMPLTALLLARTLVLNGLVGVACGWLYWRRGLEAAMIGHFSADLVLHVAAPLLMGMTGTR